MVALCKILHVVSYCTIQSMFLHCKKNVVENHLNTGRPGHHHLSTSFLSLLPHVSPCCPSHSLLILHWDPALGCTVAVTGAGTPVHMTDEVREYADFVRQSAAEFILMARATNVRRARVMARWIEMHEKWWDSYKDRELSDSDLFGNVPSPFLGSANSPPPVRIQDFLTYAVKVSQGLLHKGKNLKMAYSMLQMVIAII